MCVCVFGWVRVFVCVFVRCGREVEQKDWHPFVVDLILVNSLPQMCTFFRQGDKWVTVLMRVPYTSASARIVVAVWSVCFTES